jgi:hypothetical protein
MIEIYILIGIIGTGAGSLRVMHPGMVFRIT